MKSIDRLDDFDPEIFLNDYWQQRPCLITNWLKPAARDVSELLALADEHELPTRLISGRQESADWTLRHGPIGSDDLPTAHSNWTVLVQEVDKVCPPVSDLLSAFRFLPDWMIDDIMVSHAVDGGSVGAHVDAYDVFLIQASGHRRWQLAEQFDSGIDERFEQALLRKWTFEAEVLTGPGDTLYLPAGIAHHGVAKGLCQTWSVGLRTPSGPELLFHLAEHQAGTRADGPRLTPARPDRHQPALIAPATVDAARTLMRDCLDLDDSELSALLGNFLSGWRQWPQDPPETDLDELIDRLGAGHALDLAAGSRLALSRNQAELRLHINGEEVACPESLATELASSRKIDARWCVHPDALEQLLDLGAIH